MQGPRSGFFAGNGFRADFARLPLIRMTGTAPERAAIARILIQFVHDCSAH